MTRTLVATGILWLCVLGGVAWAAATPTAIDVSVAPAEKVAQGYTIAAHVRGGAAGKAVGDAVLSFYVMGDLFGPREVFLGKGTTDGRGDTSFTYLPSTSGEQKVVVRFGGNDLFARSEGNATFEATVFRATRRQEVSPLAEFTSRVPFGIGLVVIAVWLAIVFAFLNTVLGIARDRRAIPVPTGAAALLTQDLIATREEGEQA